MDIFEFAIQMERDGEQYYRDMAAQTSPKGLHTILLMLAEDENKHARIIADLQAQTPQMPATAILDTAKNVFRQMKDFGGRLELSGDEEKLYREAMVLEQRSISFYLDRAEQVDHAGQNALFAQLAEEERKHYRLLQEMAEFVRSPKTWLENAEFRRFEEE